MTTTKTLSWSRTVKFMVRFVWSNRFDKKKLFEIVQSNKFYPSILMCHQTNLNCLIKQKCLTKQIWSNKSDIVGPALKSVFSWHSSDVGHERRRTTSTASHLSTQLHLISHDSKQSVGGMYQSEKDCRIISFSYGCERMQMQSALIYPKLLQLGPWHGQNSWQTLAHSLLDTSTLPGGH